MRARPRVPSCTLRRHSGALFGLDRDATLHIGSAAAQTVRRCIGDCFSKDLFFFMLLFRGFVENTFSQGEHGREKKLGEGKVGDAVC